ncbi:Hypothetical protein Cul131001_1228 [Corynebacterium ulcerans]|nr:Hypothetical protein Cul131001_1228 [Corynebacterium ulcerans]
MSHDPIPLVVDDCEALGDPEEKVSGLGHGREGEGRSGW